MRLIYRRCGRPRNAHRVKLLASAILSLAIVAAGCSTGGPGPPVSAGVSQPPAVLEVPLPAALWTDEPLRAIRSGESSWLDPARGRTIRARWVAPRDHPALGLVLFLPALGQVLEASDPLVRMLAAAGYAVLAIGNPRPLAPRPPGDARPPPSSDQNDPIGAAPRPDAVPGADKASPPPRPERSAARAAFSAIAAKDRVLDARFALDQLELASPFAMSAEARGRVAVVGLELGAQTAQLLIGEQMQRQTSPAPDARVRAAVLLAPFSSFEGPAFSQRYRAVVVPLLIVFGSRESDSHGLNITAAQRRQMVKAIDAPTFSVELTDASVTELLVPRTIEAPSDTAFRMRPPMGDGPGGSAPSGKTQPPPAAGQMAGGMPARPDMPGATSPTRASAAAALRTTLLATRAFLDAELLGDKDAREWLERNSGASASAAAGTPSLRPK